MHNDCWDKLPDGAKVTGKTDDGRDIYSFTDKHGNTKTVYQGKGDDKRWYNPEVYKPNRKFTVDKNGNYHDEKGNYTHSPNKVTSDLTRPPVRQSLKDKVDAKYEWVDGKPINTKTGKPFKKHNYAHKKGYENRRMIKAADELGMNQKQLNEYVNSRHNKFELQEESFNKGGHGEKKGIGGLTRIKKDMKEFLNGDK